MKKDYYKILELTDQDKLLGQEEFEKVLKKKFRALCLLYHPDKQVGKSDEEKKEAEERFKDINEAYSVLSDHEKKAEYDMYGQVGGNGGFGGMDDLQDFINQHMNMHFGGFGQRKTVHMGTDVRIKLDCTVEDVYYSVRKKIKYGRLVTCPDCNGTGSSDGKQNECQHCHGTGVETVVERNGWMQSVTQTTCPHCGGSGRIIASPCKKCEGIGLIRVSETVDIDIPSDIRNGYQLTIRGKGNMSKDGGVPGDLLVVFNISGGMFAFMDNVHDVCCKTEVGVLDCITGCEKEVKCLDGEKIKIQIPPGSKDMTSVVVSGKGMPVNDRQYGNMVVFVEQKMPKTLTSDERKKLDEIKHMKNFK